MKVKVIRENWMNWATLVSRVNSTYIYMFLKHTFVSINYLYTHRKVYIYIYIIYIILDTYTKIFIHSPIC